ncbi:Xylanase inhibitor, C-terminal [Sesbania bispinosa]|nr:Xylanase inhibitor, C-terminal [Sesbania bispinosa]
MPKPMGTLASLVILLFCSFPLTRTRTTPHGPKTTVLDVASSIRKTHTVLAINRYHHQQPSSPSLSLQLHSRASIQNAAHTDYKSLTLSRLERDSARVRALQTRLDLATKRISQSDLHPAKSENELESEKLQAPLVSGTSQGSGEYFLRVGIGKPPSQAYVVVDTGSDVSWIQCAPCSECYQQSDPIFDPVLSGSYAQIHCEAPQCKSLDLSECRNGTCLYEVSYGDGSYTVGEFVTETVTLGSAAVDGRSHRLRPQQRRLRRRRVLPIPETSFELDASGGGGYIVDSGTAVTRLRSEVYDELRDAFVRGTRGLPTANGASLFDTCYDLSSRSSVEGPDGVVSLPDGKELPLPAKNYLDTG